MTKLDRLLELEMITFLDGDVCDIGDDVTKNHTDVYLITKNSMSYEEAESLKSEINHAISVEQRVRDEYLECDKDYDRHQTPVGWNNYGISDQVANILGCIIVGCNHDKYHKGSLCDECRVKLEKILGDKEW